MACGPNVDQAGLDGVPVPPGRGRLRRSVPSRPVTGSVGRARQSRCSAGGLLRRWNLRALLAERLCDVGNALIADADGTATRYQQLNERLYSARPLSAGSQIDSHLRYCRHPGTHPNTTRPDAGRSSTMALNFTIVVHVRHQFGAVDQDIGVFAGLRAQLPVRLPFGLVRPCPAAVPKPRRGGRSRLSKPTACRSSAASQPPTLSVVSPPEGPQSIRRPKPRAPVVGGFIGLGGQRLDHQPGRAQEQRQRPAHRLQDGDLFVIDNVVVLYKTR